MTPDELLGKMRALLAEEREGILRFDSTAVTRANESKEDILRDLRQSAVAERPALFEALEQIQPELRCNLILLTHARAYLRDVQDGLVHDRSSAPVTMPTRKAG